MNVIYYLSTCDTCNRILKELNLTGITLVDIKSNPLTVLQLEQIYKHSGSYEKLFNKRAKLYKERNLANQNLTEVDYKNLLLEHYTFLARPVAIIDDLLFVGNSKAVIADLQAKLNQ